MHPSRKNTARVTIGGKDVDINFDIATKGSSGPIHLQGDSHLPKGAANARTQQEMQINSTHNGTTFSNPSQNVHRLGLREGMKVADFGAGSGAYTLALSRIVGETGTVYAVDVQRDLLTRIQNEATQQGLENIQIIWSDMEGEAGVGIRDELLDGVLLSNTLFQIENKNRVLREAWRVLKPGGILSVIDWSDSFAGMGPPQNAVLTQAAATMVCTDNNFALKNEFSAGDHHYGLNFIKMMIGENEKEAITNSQKREKDFISRTIDQELI